MELDERALVAGELRGYRQFSLQADGLHPLVHRAAGPWGGGLQRAVCAAGGQHEAPAADCRCGLYAWYAPGAPALLGACSAVVAARGRCILGDRGFRASSARVEAVALPLSVRWWPPASARARHVLAARYPQAQVHRSTRRMLAAHPPQDLGALGITPPRDTSRAYRALLAVVFAGFLLAGYSLVLLPRAAVHDAAARWWPLVVLVVLGWHALLAWIASRLMRSSAPLVERPEATS